MNEKASEKPVSAFDLFPKSWEAFQRNISVFGILYIPSVLAVLFGVFNNHKESSYGFGTNLFSGWSGASIAGAIGGALIVSLTFIVLGIIIQALMVVAQLRSAEGKTITLSGLWEDAKPNILRLFGLSIVVGLLTIIGLILLIVPGLIVIRRYFLAPYVLVDKKLTIGEAMKISADISKSYAWSIWGVIGVTMLLSLTGIVPVIGSIISLVLAATYSIAPALRYVELKKLSA